MGHAMRLARRGGFMPHLRGSQFSPTDYPQKQLVSNLFCMDKPMGYLPRILDARLVEAMASAPVVLLDGPRGVGKTTTAARVSRTVVMLPRDMDQLHYDPEAYLRQLEPPVLLDEWQLAGLELLWAIKRIVDADPSPGRFILAGSVEPAAHGPTYPLTGRAVRLVMRPMTAAELNGTGDLSSPLSALLAGQAPALGSGADEQFTIDQVSTSGFPAARAMPEPAVFLEAYASLVAQRAGEEGRDASRLLRTLRVLATLTGQAVPDQRIWEAADVNKVTLKAYDDLLERVHLSVPLPAFESNRLKRLTSYPKRFLADTAMALTLAGLDVTQLASDPRLAGRYLESYVVQQLRPHVDMARAHLMHLRSSAGENEVDAVVETRHGVVGVEIKLARRVRSEDAKPLAWLRDSLGERFLQGVVFHTGTDVYSVSDRVYAVPLGHVTR